MSSSFIECKQVSKSFGAMTVVDGLDLAIQQGEFVSLLGPSGSGKTTILMMLAGFERPTSGEIHLNARRIDHLPPYKRQMGVVFQSYALFPHMTVAENVAFPLEMRRLPKHEIATKVERALAMVQLGHLKDRRPAQLSGGQQQRVALTRALVFEPSVILLDEPLGALDKQLREQMQLEIRDLHKRLGLTIVFVTHDQTEALTMSDRVAVFNAGKIEQLDTPEGLYDHPRSRFVAQFIGETNLLNGAPAGADGDALVVRLTGDNAIKVAHSPVGAGDVSQGDISLSLRPERIIVEHEPDGPNALPVIVEDSIYHGDHIRIQLTAPGGLVLVARCERRGRQWQPGEKAYARFAPEDLTVLR